MIRSGNRAVAKLRKNSQRTHESGGEGRLAEVSARIDSARNSSFIRRPVFNEELDVVAYELFLVEGPVAEIVVEDADDGSRRLLVNSRVDLDVAALGAGKPLHLAVTSAVLESGILAKLGPDQVTVLLGEGVESSASVITAIEELRALGFRIVLDDVETNSRLLPLVRLTHAVRINLDGPVSASLARRIAVLKQAGIEITADRVRSYEELRQATKLGFDLFQGSFFSRPDTFRDKEASPGQLAALELVSLLHDPEADISRIADVIRRDVSLSYRVLKTVNSAQYALPRPLESIEEAVMLVGTKQIATWAGMLSMSRLTDKPSELTRVAMVRARVCEELARRLGRSDAQPFYVVGLLSVIESLLDVPAEQALRNLPISNEIVSAITCGGGIMGEVLRGVLAYEGGDWSHAHILGLGDDVTSTAFRTAMIETDEAWSLIAA